MSSFRQNLLSTAAMVPLVVGVAGGGLLLAATAMPDRPAHGAASSSLNPVAAKKPERVSPVAAVRVAASCNPCATQKVCSPCNPCAAQKACGACNPCAATKTCAACNPCAAKKACSPCNPCAAQKACNPCNPCNPCAANAGLLPTECYVPSLKSAAACNPCAAKKVCAACNPCAAKKACSPCNPCAAKKACSPCNPCNPCAAMAVEVDVPAEEMLALYDCLQPKLKAAYAKGDHWAAKKWTDWSVLSTMGYRSETHGGRFVQNAVNPIGAAAYGKYEEVKAMPIGSTIAKPSFVVAPDGQASVGPLFLMEKMTRGWNSETADWRYAMIMPDGSTFGITKGHNAAGMGFCVECHAGAEDNDYMLFMPDEFRRN